MNNKLKNKNNKNYNYKKGILQKIFKACNQIK
jgi:hypothetical protein